MKILLYSLYFARIVSFLVVEVGHRERLAIHRVGVVDGVLKGRVVEVPQTCDRFIPCA